MKYMWQSTSPNISTGYGILTKNVCERLIKKGVDLKILGMQNIGYQEKEYNLPMLDDVYGSDAIQFYSKLYNIDYLITVLDNFVPVYHYIPPLLKRLNVKHIAHVTANSVPLLPSLFNQIKGADFLVAPSRFVEKVLLEAGVNPKRVRYIPHGVNTKIFKPLPKDEMEKHKQMIGYKDKFVFLSVATNTGGEKNWPGLFYAYKIFLHQNPDAKERTILHCHTNPHCQGGYDLDLLGRMYGITENIRFIAGVGLNAGMPQKEMSKLWRLIGVNSHEFSKVDRAVFLYAALYAAWGIVSFVVLCILSAMGLMSDDRWIAWWHIVIYIMLGIACVGSVWVSIGGLIDLRKMYKRLAARERNELDDGRILATDN